jgi:imidazolonepropionase-like amidohydrolase
MDIIIRGRRIIDGTGKPPFAGTVVVEGNRISDINEDEKKSVTGPKIIDVGDDTVMPGFVDAHCHLSWGPQTADGTAWYRRIPRFERGDTPGKFEFVDSNHQRAILAVVNMGIDLQTGVTTVRNVSETTFLGLAVKQAVEEGVVPGPRIFFGGIGIRARFGHGGNAQGFDGPEAMREAVRQNLMAGADMIKIYVSGGSNDLHTEVTTQYMTREEIAAVVDEAHHHGRMVASHCCGGQGLTDCLELGVDTIEHGSTMTDEDIEKMAGTNAYFIANPIVLFPHEFENRLSHPIVVAKRAKVAEQFPFPHIIRKVAEKGIKMAVGTDGRHGLIADNVAKLVEFGLPAMDAIMAATKTGAEVCAAQDRLGTLEKNKLADIVVVKGNPLENIKVLKEVCMVIKDGEIVKRESN